MLQQALILAGGLGSRLGEITKHTPKPMVEVNNRPFLEYIIAYLRKQGIPRIVLSVGHFSEQIISHFGDGVSFGVSIVYAIEAAPAGTGGALAYAKSNMEDNFFVLNGDTIFDIPLEDLSALHSKGKGLVTMALREVPDAGRFGEVELDENNRVKIFAEKNKSGPGLINGGIYAMQRRAMDYLPSAPCSLEKDLFPMLARNALLNGKSYDAFFIDIGIKETLGKAGRLMADWMKPANGSLSHAKD
jgi:NDP-sugar pyrophosphorylase family protein